MSAEKAPLFCYELVEVFGQRYLDAQRLMAKQRRNAIAEEQYTIAYLVQGKFREDEQDNGVVDVRWVDLEDLIDNSVDLSMLEAYEEDLQRDMEWRREQMRQ